MPRWRTSRTGMRSEPTTAGGSPGCEDILYPDPVSVGRGHSVPSRAQQAQVSTRPGTPPPRSRRPWPPPSRPVIWRARAPSWASPPPHWSSPEDGVAHEPDWRRGRHVRNHERCDQSQVQGCPARRARSVATSEARADGIGRTDAGCGAPFPASPGRPRDRPARPSVRTARTSCTGCPDPGSMVTTRRV